ncbi:MAG: response regulator [Magnetococcales bacterium]|nr:response regulator [Magnetococcales bacterium]MBF0117039.1 response regulator [Magnetococcales bacterium]
MGLILIVDDDADFRCIVAELLTKSGFNSMQVSSGSKALSLISSQRFDIILLDLVFPGMDGLETLREIRRMDEKVKVILVSAFITVENTVMAIKLGATDVLTKPFRQDDFSILMHRTMQEIHFERQMWALDMGPGLEMVLKCLANTTRREIIFALSNHPSMRLGDLQKELSITDYTKLTFHLKNLMEHDLVSKSTERGYALTPRGRFLQANLMQLFVRISKLP